MKLVYGDFMKSDHKNRLVLTFGSMRDLEKHDLQIAEGLHLLFYNEDETDDGVRDDLVVEGVVEYDREKERWVAIIDWDAIKNISRLTDDEKEKYQLRQSSLA